MDFVFHFDRLARSLGILLGFYIIYLIGVVLYNIYLHPLRQYPGPVSWAATRIPFAIRYFSGDLYLEVHELHKKYGTVVRIAPDELSIIDPKAGRDIHTASAGKKLMSKDGRALVAIKKHGTPENLLTAMSDEDHARMKRGVLNAFSDRALKNQEQFMQHYVALFIESLNNFGKVGPINIVQWFEFLAFDIIGDLTFGESQIILKKQTSDWLFLTNEIFRAGMRATTIVFFQHLRPLLQYLLPFSPSRRFLETHSKNVETLLSKRMDIDSDRKDFAFYALETQKIGDPRSLMTRSELLACFEVFMVAGSDTTTSALSACIYFLGTHAEVYDRLVQDIRGTFTVGTDITILSTGSQKQRYLSAVLEEAMRLMPPVASGLPRIVPPEGATVAGRYIPGGTRVVTPLWAAGRSADYFRDPELFIPERWLGDPKYEADHREACNQFGIGPRSCIGKNLAYAELRIILARLLFEFDFEILEESQQWLAGMKNFSLWSREPLMVNLTPVLKSGLSK